jgi:DNA-binding PadR family transcriptional regulator
MSRESLGHFELLVLLALLRQGEDAYGVPIADAIEESTGKPVILASVYNTLERLEQKGLVKSAVGEPTPERGGRAKRYFAVTAAGLREVAAAKKALKKARRPNRKANPPLPRRPRNRRKPGRTRAREQADLFGLSTPERAGTNLLPQLWRAPRSQQSGHGKSRRRGIGDADPKTP